MITDEEIAAIEAKCRYSPDGKRWIIDKRQRDRAIYQLGRQRQRESDAFECNSLAEYYSRKASEAERREEEISYLAKNFACRDLASIVRNNTGELE